MDVYFEAPPQHLLLKVKGKESPFYPCTFIVNQSQIILSSHLLTQSASKGLERERFVDEVTPPLTDTLKDSDGLIAVQVKLGSQWRVSCPQTLRIRLLCRALGSRVGALRLEARGRTSRFFVLK